MDAERKRSEAIQALRGHRASWLLTTAVFVCGLVATASLAYVLSSLNEARRWRQVDYALEANSNALRAEVERITGILRVTAAFFAASREVEPEEFSLFAQSLWGVSSDGEAVFWVPRIKPASRSLHEARAFARGLKDYAVVEADGSIATANKIVYPSWYSAQHVQTKLVPLGFDWSSIPPVLLAMEQARDIGQIVASPPISEWLPSGEGPLGVLASPVYSKDMPVGSVAERRAALDGFILFLESPRSLLQNVANLRTSEIGALSMYLVDTTDPKAPSLVSGAVVRQQPHQAEVPAVKTLLAMSQEKGNHVAEIMVAGRVWHLIGIPRGSRGSAAILLATLGGVWISSLLATLVWLVLGRIGKDELARLQAISESATDGIVTANDEGNITFFNAAAAAMFGRSAHDVLGKPLTELMPHSLRDKHRKAFARYLSTREARVVGKGPITLTGLRADGSEFPIDLALGSWHSNGDKPHFAAVIRDATARRNLERQLISAKELAEAASRAKSEFLAKMSHELRTPLNAIVGLSDLMRDATLTSSQHADLAQISRSADGLLRLVNDILDLSRIEAGRLELAEEPFSLRMVVEDSIQPLIRRAQVKGLEMTCRVAPAIPDALLGDGGRLQQILLNVVGNAVKFTERGEVEVNVELAGQKDDRVHLLFSVKDSGPGITLSQRPTIFDLFVQGEAGSKHAEGIGLGLATAFQLVGMMGGRIWLDEDVEVGSRFLFDIDVQLDKNAGKHEARQHQLKGTRILIVDDNAMSRKVLAETAESWDMLASLAADGLQALSMLRAAASEGKLFQLVLLDSSLPDISGVQLARAIRDETCLPSIPCILMSSNPISDAEIDALELDLVAQLEKPISRSHLLEAIERALRISQTQLKARAERRSSSSSLRILLAEDNPINQIVTSRMLEQFGHEVITVDNGAAAVAVSAEKGFDVVLMDYEMPILNGLEAARAIRERERSSGQHLCIIALTAYAMQEDRERLMAAGMDAVLTKPVRMETLSTALDEVTQKLAAQLAAEASSPALPPPSTRAPPARSESPRSAEGSAPRTLPTQVATRSLINVSHLMRPGQSDSLLELTDMLLDQLPGLEREIATAIAGSDAARLRMAAHTLKGSLGLFGAEEAAERAQRLEHMGKSERLEGADEAAQALAIALRKVEVELTALKVELAQRPGLDAAREDAARGDAARGDAAPGDAPASR